MYTLTFLIVTTVTVTLMRLLQKWLTRKMRIYLHFAKEKADLWQNIWKINDFCLSLQRE